jgi:hypothetical protein
MDPVCYLNALIAGDKKLPALILYHKGLRFFHEKK